jgi:hypothetical protein
MISIFFSRYFSSSSAAQGRGNEAAEGDQVMLGIEYQGRRRDQAQTSRQRQTALPLARFHELGLRRPAGGWGRRNVEVSDLFNDWRHSPSRAAGGWIGHVLVVRPAGLSCFLQKVMVRHGS